MLTSVVEPRENQNRSLKLESGVINIALDDLPHQVFAYEEVK